MMLPPTFGLTILALAFHGILGFTVSQTAEKSYCQRTVQLNGAVVDLTDDNFSQLLSQSSSPLTLVDFYAPWCGPCKLMESVLDEVAEQYDADHELLVCRYNVEGRQSSDKSQPNFKVELAVRGFMVRALPALVLLDARGKVLTHWTGMHPKGTIEEGLRPYLLGASAVTGTSMKTKESVPARGRIHIGTWQQQEEDSYMLTSRFNYK